MKEKRIEAVDLFCGAGGLTAGLIKAGIKVKAGYDIEETCRYAYESNNQLPFINKDVNKLTKKELESLFSNNAIRLLAGCAPCQPFSTYNQGKDIRNDKKWPLLYAFARLIREINPELVTMENVSDVTKHQVYHDFVKNLHERGYNVWANTVSCADYGIPQMRKRHVLLASRIGNVSLLPPTNTNRYITVKEAIGNLPAIKAGEKSQIDTLHFAARLSKKNLARIRASKPGGSWKDWPIELLADCHKKNSGKTYRGVYGRMQWDKPAPTMTTQCYGFGNGRFGHPEQDRAISLREAAIFQTFPNDYQFYDAEKETPKIGIIGQMIGNAVPVKLGYIIGLSFLNIYHT
ncbi:DNA cytosine methyltransferase [Snodgrassella alvi]|uniref:DNA cytosine methyltransferase n=1 Tax=Snodgrassella alvi TaxID=1196083 RepID=UPI003463C193